MVTTEAKDATDHDQGEQSLGNEGILVIVGRPWHEQQGCQQRNEEGQIGLFDIGSYDPGFLELH